MPDNDPDQAAAAQVVLLFAVAVGEECTDPDDLHAAPRQAEQHLHDAQGKRARPPCAAMCGWTDIVAGVFHTNPNIEVDAAANAFGKHQQLRIEAEVRGGVAAGAFAILANSSSMN